MDWKKLLGEGAKEMLQGAALGAVKEMGKAMVERDQLKEKLEKVSEMLKEDCTDTNWRKILNYLEVK